MKKKIKKLEKYQTGGSIFNQAPVNDPLNFLFRQGMGMGLPANQNNFDYLNIQDNPFGNQISNSVFNTGKEVSGFFDQKPLEYQAWLQENKKSDNFINKVAYQQYQNIFTNQSDKNKEALNKATPIMSNMVALDELNKLSELEYKKGLKRDASDVSNDMKGLENRGFFAQQGGVVEQRPMPSIEEIKAKRADFVKLYASENEKKQEALRKKLTLSGLTQDKIDTIMEEVWSEYPDDDRKDKSEFLSKKLIETVKDKTGYFLPDAKDEIVEMFKLDNLYRTTMDDFRSLQNKVEYPEENTQKSTPTAQGRKFKYFGQGGNINPLQQALGYKDNSPFKELPSQTILRSMSPDGVNITMDNVSKDLYLIPDVGAPVRAKGNSGGYFFPKATKVEEVPAMEEGGMPAMEGVPQAGLGKFLKSVGNAVSDWGVGVADSFGNRLGIYDIDNKHYKTGIGQQFAGINDKLQSVTGKIGQAVAATAVPGLGAVLGALPQSGGQSGQMPVQQGTQPGQMGQIDYSAMLPYLMQFLQGPNLGAQQGMYQQGGMPILNLSGKINPMRLSPRGVYKFGGLITEGSEYNKRKQPKKNSISGASSTGPMGPKDIPSYDSGIRAIIDQEKYEIIPTENLLPVQTEVGELIVLPTGDIVPVMAKKRHHQMDEDEVTDIAPEGAYILSAHGKVRIKKDEANRVITETGVKPYRLGQGQDKPTEKTLAHMMSKKDMSPADVGRKIMQAFPVVATSNPYEAAANSENKINRRPYLEGVIQLSEYDKARKGIDTQPQEAPEMAQGGNVMFRDGVSQAQTGLEIPLIMAGAQGLIGLFGASAAKNDAYGAYKDVVKIASQAADREKQYLGAGTAAGIVGTLSQNPNVDPVLLTPSYINQTQTRTPSTLINSVANDAYANMPDYRNLPANQQLMGNQAAYAQALKSAGDARMTAYYQDRAAENQRKQALQGYLDTNTKEIGAAKRASILNRNQMLGNVGDRTQGLFDSYAGVEANLANTQANARLGQASANQGYIRSVTQGLSNVVGTAGAAAYDYYSNKTNTPSTNNNSNSTPLNSLNNLSNLPGGGIQMYNGTPYSTGVNTLSGYNGFGSPTNKYQFSTGCVFIGGKWINRVTGQPC